MSYQDFAYYYDQLMEDVPYAQWLSYAKRQWERLGSPHSVVDLGCGTGTLSIPLAQAGCQVIGIDLSEDMLSNAQEKAEQCLRTSSFARGGSVEWLHQDMREWEWSHPVDAVISFCDCMNYLTEESDIIQTFNQVYQGLKPGGSFLFDVHTPEQMIVLAQSQPFFYNEENVAYIWTSELDEERLEIEHAITFFVKALPKKQGAESDLFRRFEEVHVQRAYDLSWLKQQLEHIGFEDITVTADFMNTAPNEQSARAFFACKK